MEHGYDVPLLVNMQPAGQYLSERFHRAGGVPAVMWELLQAGKLDGSALTCTGRTQAENLEGREATDREVIFPYSAPLKERAGFLVLSGNLFDFAIMKTSVIREEFRQRYLSRRRARRRVRVTCDRVRRLRTTTTTGSTIRRSTSTRIASSSSAARVCSAGPALPRS